MSSFSKGRKKETEICNYLRAEGWTILFKSHLIRKGPLCYQYDFATIFDIVAVKTNVWRFISSKHNTNTGGPKHYAELQKFNQDHCQFWMSVERWVYCKPGYYGRGKKKIYRKKGFFNITYIELSEELTTKKELEI